MTSSLAIRPAKPAERDKIEALQRRASLAWEDDREALLANPDAIELPIDRITNDRTYVAEQRGELVGFSVVLPRSDGDAELDGLFVEPTAWRSAVGTQLVLHAEHVAVREGAAFLWVVSGPQTEGFYAKCGFERIGETQTRFGKACTMRKALATTPLHS